MNLKVHMLFSGGFLPEGGEWEEGEERECTYQNFPYKNLINPRLMIFFLIDQLFLYIRNGLSDNNYASGYLTKILRSLINWIKVKEEH